MHRRWLVNRTNPEFLGYLSRAASVSPAFAQVLINRGIKSASDVKDFLSPSVSALSDPFSLRGMPEAVGRIAAAREKGERVLVHGDYDADGLTATAIAVSVLRQIGLDVTYFIPNRHRHGYGFHSAGVRAAQNAGATLIVTVDCGIGSFDAVVEARGAGIDVIITDHHEPGAPHPPSLTAPAVSSPAAAAVVNPKIPGNPPGLAILSGAGIVFKLAQALAADGRFAFNPDDCRQLLDLAALGTMADVVPLVGENRVLVREGLDLINRAERPGVAGLRAAAGLNNREVKAMTLAFTLIPRLNAAGRMEDASEAVNMLLTDQREEAMQRAEWLDGLNSERQRVEAAVSDEAQQMLEAQRGSPAVVLAAEGWHEGVLGIVASRIAEQLYRPAFVLAVTDGVAKGSARSIPAFDLHAALEECSDLLLGFGGHRQAAGLRLKQENLSAFAARMRTIVQTRLASGDLSPVLEIDANLALASITPALVRELEMLDPLGYGNPEPLFGARGLEVVTPRIVGNNHLKLRLKERSVSIDAIGFDMGGQLEMISDCAGVDAVFTPGVNEWNGSRYLQLMLRAFRPSDGGG